MTPLGSLITAILSVLVFAAPRRLALTALFAGIIYLPQMQSITIGGLNIFAFRLLEIAGFIRVIGRNELSRKRLCIIDKVFVALFAYATIVYALRTTDNLLYRVGVAVDAYLCYFAFRGLISEKADEFRAFLCLAVILIIPFALAVCFETIQQRNLFSFLGANTGGADMIRDGRLRARGTFRHASLMGTLGATLLPLYIALFFDPSRRKFAVLGIIASLLIVLASNSGGPLSATIIALSCWALWTLRRHLSKVQLAAASLFLLVWLVMKAPIWYLIARVSSFTGGGGWHRARLMEQAWNHIGEWWLAGMPFENTSTWFPYYVHKTGGADITNQFIGFGVRSGVGAILLFILTIATALTAVGRQFRKSLDYKSNAETALYWGLGSTVTVHIFNWLGISYFDQTYALWYLHLASVASLTTLSVEEQKSEHPPPELDFAEIRG